jgi:hypothetical protein
MISGDACDVIRLRGVIKMLLLTRNDHQSAAVGNEIEGIIVDTVVFGIIGTSGVF